MQVARLYTPLVLDVAESVTLDEGASRHLLRVLRARLGDPVILFNGRGGEYQGKLVAIDANRAVVTLLNFSEPKRDSSLTIHLGQVISRGYRMDYAVQKATELGVTTITPLFSERCNVRLPQKRLLKRVSHWQSVANAASEQSGRCYLPQVQSPRSLVDYVAQKREGLHFICDVMATHTIDYYLRQQRGTANFTLVVGPEGGFTRYEIDCALDQDFQLLSLGPLTLRAETAPIVALSLLQSFKV